MSARVRIYLLSLVALALVLLLRRALDPILGADFPLVTLFGAVAAAIWVGGSRPAVLVTVLGYLAANLYFMEPRAASNSPAWDGWSAWSPISSPVP